MNSALAFLHGLLVALLQCLGDGDDMLPLIMLKQLQGCAAQQRSQYQMHSSLEIDVRVHNISVGNGGLLRYVVDADIVRSVQ